MNWINPPESVKRFSLQQMLQHGAAMLFMALLLFSALFPRGWGGLHGNIGLLAAAFLLLHFFSLLVIGVRHDSAVDHIAFLPVGGDGGTGDPAGVGKYSLPEKWDYFLILFWSLLAAVSGIVLHWPGKFGVPGPKAFAWLRIAHAALGGAWLLHLLGSHAIFRFVSPSPGMRWSIFTGKVPLESVESRGGWTRLLVASGILVPVPAEQQAESQRETLQVRELLEEGNRLTREGQFDEAAVVYEEALRLYPEYSQARFNLAVSRIKQGRPELAAEQFRIFLEADPFNPMAGKARELLDGLVKSPGGGVQ